MKTILRGIMDVDASDFGLDSLEYQMLVRAYKMGEQVEVLAVACEGDTHLHSYYDIKLSNGLIIDAIAGTHLVDIDRFRTDTSVVVQCQLVVDIQYIKTGCPIDTSVLEDYVTEAVRNTLQKTKDITEMPLHDVTTVFETSFETKRVDRV